MIGRKMVRKMKAILFMKVITKQLFGKIGMKGNLIIRLTDAMEMRIVLKSCVAKQSGKINVVVKENLMFVRRVALVRSKTIQFQHFITI